MVMLTASDGDNSFSVVSSVFRLGNKRQKQIDNVFTKIIGLGQGPMTLNISDSAMVKDHDYIIAFREEEFTSTLVYDFASKSSLELACPQELQGYSAEVRGYDSANDRILVAYWGKIPIGRWPSA